MQPVVFEKVTYRYEDTDAPIFQDLDISLPQGVMSIIGQNGTGKSTLLLLAGAVLIPQAGRVLVNGTDSTELRDEHERHREVSFIYQNMEFETEEPIGALLGYVYENGFHESKNESFVRELVRVCELESCLAKKTQEVSKGQLQRAIIAFSLLYGSKLVMMDEPVFALEDYQKTRIFGYLMEYAHSAGLTVYYSVHELELSRTFSDYLMLFGNVGTMEIGPTSEMYDRTRIEEAYQVPFDMLKHKESLFRKLLSERARAG